MSQNTQHIGQCSPDVDRVAAEMQGWGGPVQAPGLPANPHDFEPLRQEVTDPSDYSFRDRRANRQALGWSGGLGPFTPAPPMAGHWEGSMAAQQVSPINQFHEPGA